MVGGEFSGSDPKLEARKQPVWPGLAGDGSGVQPKLSRLATSDLLTLKQQHVFTKLCSVPDTGVGVVLTFHCSKLTSKGQMHH